MHPTKLFLSILGASSLVAAAPAAEAEAEAAPFDIPSFGEFVGKLIPQDVKNIFAKLAPGQQLAANEGWCNSGWNDNGFCGKANLDAFCCKPTKVEGYTNKRVVVSTSRNTKGSPRCDGDGIIACVAKPAL